MASAEDYRGLGSQQGKHAVTMIDKEGVEGSMVSLMRHLLNSVNLVFGLVFGIVQLIICMLWLIVVFPIALPIGVVKFLQNTKD